MSAIMCCTTSRCSHLSLDISPESGISVAPLGRVQLGVEVLGVPLDRPGLEAFFLLHVAAQSGVPQVPPAQLTDVAAEVDEHPASPVLAPVLLVHRVVRVTLRPLRRPV